jgi:3D-(3,5/4)-trihydroxycyclohexane-1,2-dione acylhydrolase (decyclizing)
MAQPDREVYAVIGDGSYLMLNHEIVTSVQEGRKITIVLLDNHGYQCIHNLQRSCGSGGFGNEFRERDAESGRLTGANVAVDFVANARSLGAAAFAANTEEELVQALNAARAETRTSLVYVPIEAKTPIPGYSWWDVPVSEESDAADVQAARRAYQKALRARRFYY